MSAITESVLCYFPDPEPGARAEGVFAALGIAVRQVAPREVTQTVGYLAGLPGYSARPAPLVPPRIAAPMLVLSGLMDLRLDEALAALRRANLTIPHKAVLTPTNAGWTLAALYEELDKEHRAL
ncbi:MAG: DUF3783 domain-containing protein, partial [Pseudoflavonifractor sp.]